MRILVSFIIFITIMSAVVSAKLIKARELAKNMTSLDDDAAGEQNKKVPNIAGSAAGDLAEAINNGTRAANGGAGGSTDLMDHSEEKQNNDIESSVDYGPSGSETSEGPNKGESDTTDSAVDALAGENSNGESDSDNDASSSSENTKERHKAEPDKADGAADGLAGALHNLFGAFLKSRTRAFGRAIRHEAATFHHVAGKRSNGEADDVSGSSENTGESNSDHLAVEKSNAEADSDDDDDASGSTENAEVSDEGESEMADGAADGLAGTVHNLFGAFVKSGTHASGSAIADLADMNDRLARENRNGKKSLDDGLVGYPGIKTRSLLAAFAKGKHMTNNSGRLMYNSPEILVKSADGLQNSCRPLYVYQ